ncbi:Hemolysin-type calcium-binding repeat-containing protein, partial [Rubrimonas cliftonensis]
MNGFLFYDFLSPDPYESLTVDHIFGAAEDFDYDGALEIAYVHTINTYFLDDTRFSSRAALFSGARDDLALLDRLDGVEDGRVGYDAVVNTVVAENDGDRLLSVRGSFPESAFLIGGDGDDTLISVETFSASGKFASVLEGGGGRDRLIGAGGDDRLSGGDGDDTLKSGGGDDRVSGGAGDDVALSGDGDDAMFGQSGDDIFKAGRGDDNMDGGAGDDFLSGWRGADSISGGEGDDVIRGDFDAAMLRKGGWRRDSRRESSVIAGVDEQADTPDV